MIAASLLCRSVRILASSIAVSLTVQASDRPELVLADFEAENYGSWAATGEAFGSGPAKGSLPGQMAVEGYSGKGLVNSFHKGDKSTGTLTSHEFPVERHYLQFLIGGGGFEGKTCLNLLVEGKVVRSATGPNTDPGGSERLELQGWDVTEFAGRKAKLQIVDEATSGWGHVNVDQIVLTDVKPPMTMQNASREMVAEKRYLHLPVKNGAKKRVVTVSAGGVAVRKFDIELADAAPDWWAFLDISTWKGKTLTISAGRLTANSAALRSLTQSETQPNQDTLYQEALRPQFHFSPRRGWTNDPNGLVRFHGEHHLFFQHNPYGWNWGNMHWGHAVSADLVHWEELGEALYPDDTGTMFSGSAVVDTENTSGFGSKDRPPLVLFYTSAGNEFTQNLAYSTDGRTFVKYDRNPVVKQITHGNRDPKVIWHQPTKQWVMTLYVEKSGHTIHFLTSKNLRDWEVVSETAGLFECPDFFELPVLDNDRPAKGEDPTRWILTAASSEYFIGSFDGRIFRPETPKLPGHRGKGFYAAQTFSDIPDRRIQIGWGQMPSPGMPFNQIMCFPTEMKLLRTEEGPRLSWTPVKELALLRETTLSVSSGPLPAGKNAFANVSAELVEIGVTVAPQDAREIRLEARGAVISWAAASRELSVNGHKVPAPLREGKLDLHVLVDRTSVEVFACRGTVYVPMPFIARSDSLTASLTAIGGEAKLDNASAFKLKSIWRN